MGEPEALQEKIARLTRERDEMAIQAGACAEQLDRIRVEIGTVRVENADLMEGLVLECRRLRTALAESERKRVEAEHAAIGLAQAAYGVDATAPSEAQMERLHLKASLIFASNPTQETPEVQG